jgi:hypothetical protein
MASISLYNSNIPYLGTASPGQDESATQVLKNLILRFSTAAITEETFLNNVKQRYQATIEGVEENPIDIINRFSPFMAEFDKAADEAGYLMNKKTLWMSI